MAFIEGPSDLAETSTEGLHDAGSGIVIQETFGRECAGSGDPRTARTPMATTAW